MFRLLLRLLGLWFVALALVALVIDATSTIAAGSWSTTSFGQYWFDFAPESLAAAQAFVQGEVNPVLWDPVALKLLVQPAWLIVGPLGFLLLWIGDLGRGRRRRRLAETV